MARPKQTPLPAPIRDLFTELRRRIRRYVIWEGVAVAALWLTAMFWIGLMLDYLPVRLGAAEMPVAARAVLLAIIGCVLLYILYRFILRRTIVKLRDRNMAMLCERRFPQFDHSLITTVEMHDQPSDSPLHEQMLQSAREQALRHIPSVDPALVFEYGPLKRLAAGAAALLVSMLVFGLLAQTTCGVWLSRLFTLSERTYPRQTQLDMIDFPEGVRTVARGSDLTIQVTADAYRSTPPPRVCTIFYNAENGQRGRVNMSKKGTPRDGLQTYTVSGKPFKSVLDDIRFDVVGNDFRIRDQRVRVVDSPEIVSAVIRCERPAYTNLVAGNVDYYPNLPLPRGSRLTVQLTTNKLIQRAEIKASEEADAEVLEFANGAAAFDYRVDPLADDVRHEIVLVDTEGVTSKRPYVVNLSAVLDEPPVVGVRLRGIGTAITPDALIPVEGRIYDDYGVARSWYELALADDSVRDFRLSVSAAGEVDTGLDLRELRTAGDAEGNRMELPVGSKVTVSVQAADHFDLDSEPNVGLGDRYELDVVAPSRLVVMLEARELALRKRYEQIILEMREMRDSLARVRYDSAGESSAPTTANEETTDEDAADEAAAGADEAAAQIARLGALRKLRVQRAAQHSKRAAQEVEGVALSFDDIRMELINNRIDAQDRMNRIEKQIADPLMRIATKMYPALDFTLADLQESVDDAATAKPLAETSVSQADEILLEMDLILEQMLNLETYTELIDLVRDLIDDQQQIETQTRKQQKKRALDLLD